MSTKIKSKSGIGEPTLIRFDWAIKRLKKGEAIGRTV